ncbi:hypothetical protein GCM10011316_22650 [Roseibium aquae]|uniref:Uncharacterized protein n=1 Tax=Roseibium aquae TaxID=1323746 RepID=A0A916TLA4_9HYPH|nr:hypothetical protein [Roseibium aquae]GGB50000.1 hypothetical protein GCM10011316_22650 [Roseibium aquae]
MATIVIYGRAVQQARNLLRSAQISTMFDILENELFKSGSASASAFASAFSIWLNALPAAGPQKAQDKLAAAKMRSRDFVADDGTILDVFAIGDVLRLVGEYIEEGGGGDNSATVEAFRAQLRNQLAFNRANRARQPVKDFDLSEHPDLGIFKLQLLDRSTVKFMERFYGPYIGADISGTTTDALDVLAYWLAERINPKVTKERLQIQAGSAIRLGEELVPIACMVLQYHHSLMECGLALSLASQSMSPGDRETAAALSSFNFYDYHTLNDSAAREPITPVLERGNKIVSANLAGRGLAVIRDVIDIQGNDFMDTEIALLLENPAKNDLFQINKSYYAFSNERKEQAESSGDPSLAVYADGIFGNDVLGGVPFKDLVKMDNMGLQDLRNGVGSGLVFNDLDKALIAAGKPAPALAAAPSGEPAPSGAPREAAGTGEAVSAVAPSPSSAGNGQPPLSIAQQLRNLDPKRLAALEVLLGNK